MSWLYSILGGIALCFLVYSILSIHAGALFALAEIDIYEAISFEFALKETVIEKLLKNKSSHIQNFLSAPFFLLLMFLYRINLRTKDFKKMILEGVLLGPMQKGGLVEVKEDSITKEDLLARLFLLDGLDDADRKAYQDFLEGKDAKIIALKKVVSNLEKIARTFKDEGNDKAYEELMAILLSLKEGLEKIELTFIRKKPGGKRTPKRSFKPFLNPGLVLN